MCLTPHEKKISMKKRFNNALSDWTEARTSRILGGLQYTKPTNKSRELANKRIEHSLNKRFKEEPL